MSSAALLLADGRFPSGAHAHSFGVEAACGLGDIATEADLREFVHGRLHTTGRVEAAFTAAVCAAAARGPVPWTVFDTEFAARTASPVVQAASRSLGRQLLRAAERVWPSPVYADVRAGSPVGGPFQPVVMGAVAAVAGLSPEDAARSTLHHLVSAMTTAAVRLLGLDPFEVAALSAGLAGDVDRLATEAAAGGSIDPAALPSTLAVLADVLAEHHATWEVRLFAS